MRTIIHIQGVQFRRDSEVAKTHVIIGQRDEAYFAPIQPAENEDATDEERAAIKAEYDLAVRRHALDSTSGKFRLKPLDWTASEAEAIERAQAFAAPEWINISIKKITDIGQIIEHA